MRSGSSSAVCNHVLLAVRTVHDGRSSFGFAEMQPSATLEKPTSKKRANSILSRVRGISGVFEARTDVTEEGTWARSRHQTNGERLTANGQRQTAVSESNTSICISQVTLMQQTERAARFGILVDRRTRTASDRRGLVKLHVVSV